MISPEVLRRYPYFAGIDEESLKQLAMIAEEKTVPVGTVLFREGDPATPPRHHSQGRGEHPVPPRRRRIADGRHAGRRDLLMWSALVEPYKATALGTTTKATHLACIDGAKLRVLCEQEPMLGYRLMTQVARAAGPSPGRRRVQLAVV